MFPWWVIPLWFLYVVPVRAGIHVCDFVSHGACSRKLEDRNCCSACHAVNDGECPCAAARHIECKAR